MAFNNAVNASQSGFQSITTGGVWNGRTLTAGTGISISNGDGTGGNPVITATNAAITTWTDEAISYAAVDDNGYMSTAAVTGSLPAAGQPNGTTIAFVASTAALHTISPATTDKIRLGSALTTNGTGSGKIVSTAIGDSVQLVYQSSSGIWIATSVIGNWTVV